MEGRVANPSEGAVLPYATSSTAKKCLSAMRITKEQEELLDSLECKRLSSSKDNLYLVDDFYNTRNASLVTTLQNEAFEEDDNGDIAYYVVKNSDNKILFFFSLKSGLLYDQHIDEKTVKFMKKVNAFIEQSMKDPDMTEEQIVAFSQFLEKLRSHKGISTEDLDRISQKPSTLIDDLKMELNQNITHVGKTYSAVEMVHFCANNAMDEWWEAQHMPHTLGTIIFWKFIVPIVIQSRDLIGNKYFYLFAADLSMTERLINYYSHQLKFTLDTERATVKPLYDLSCKFMYQETKDIDKQRSLFFENFNEEEN